MKTDRRLSLERIGSSGRNGRRTRLRFVSWGVASAAVVAALAPSALLAQPAEGEDASEANEIIVTAQRRAERLEDVPMAITAISAEQFSRSGLTGMFDLGQVTPGVMVNSGTQATPTIRGVTSLTFGAGIESNVAVYVDGFYEPSTFTMASDLPNIASVEVLKGPQGTLYGRNATGGAILINTLAPSATPTGRIKLSYGNFDDRQLSAYVSGPLVGSIRASVAGYYRKSDGYIKLIDRAVVGKAAGNAAPKEQAIVRTKAEFDLAESIKATLGYNFVRTNDPLGQIFSTLDYVPASVPPPPGRITRLGTAALNVRSVNRTTKHEGTLTLAYEQDSIAVTSRTAYSHNFNRQQNDLDGSYADLLSNEIERIENTFQQSLDASTSFADQFELLIGASYFNNDLKPPAPVYTTVRGPNGAVLQNLITYLKTEAFSAYVDGTAQITPSLSLTLGGRYTRETKRSSGTIVGSPVVLVGRKTFEKFTPRASLRYTLAPRSNVYLSWTRGFRSGNFPTSPTALPELYVSTRPEDIDAFEIGFKTAGPLIHFDAAAFYYDYTNIQVSAIIPRPGCTNCGVVSSLTNADSARIYGIEGQITLTPTDETNIWAGASWLHARYRDFPNASGAGLNPANNTNIIGQVQDWSGLDMLNSPSFTANVGASHNIPLGGGSLLLSGNTSYTSSFVREPSVFGPLAGTLARVQRYKVPGYFLLNIQAGWTDPSERFTVSAFANNVLDETYLFRYGGNSFGDYKIIGSPRAYGVRLEYAF
jgi:iron complex outermembrane receptor protein